jgi:hypothetical protein
MDYTAEEMEQLRLSVAIMDWTLDEIEGCQIRPQLFVNASRYIDEKLHGSIENDESFDVETCLEEMQFQDEEVTLSIGWLVALIGSMIEKDREMADMTQEQIDKDDQFWVAWKNVCDENAKKRYPPLS